MTDYRWFRLMLFTLGLYFVGNGCYEILFYGIYAVRDLMRYGEMMGKAADLFVSGILPAVPGVLKLGFGIFLMRGGGGLTRWILQRVEHNCARCDYDLRTVKGTFCPECGLEFDPARVQKDVMAPTKQS